MKLMKPETTTDQAKEYALIKNQLFILEIILTILFLSICLVSGLSKFLRDIAYKTSENTFFLVAVYLVLFSSISYLVALPLNFYRGYILEHQFSLSNLTLKGWLKKELKKNIIIFNVLLFITQVVYIFLNVSPRMWWFKAALLCIGVSVFLARITPTFILPLFYKYKPLENEKLKKKLLWLAQRANTKVSEVSIIDFSRETKKANAALVGIGKGKKIILTDTLMDNFYQEEIEVVLAHELAHYKFRHIWKLLAVNSVSTIVGFYLAHRFLGWSVDFFGFHKISDVANFPLISLLLFVFGLIIMPLQNYYSRKLEKQADNFSLQATDNPQAFISAMIRLGKQNLADMTPPSWVEILLYDHPSIITRVKQADVFWKNKEMKQRFV